MRASALVAGFAADLLVGDPRRFHPVAGFGQAAAAVERTAYSQDRRRGVLVTGALVGGAAAAVAGLARAAARFAGGRCATAVLVTWTALGGRSLRRQALSLAALIEQGELTQARVGLRALCGRDTADLDAAGLSRAVVESVAENTSDAVVGALLWGAVAGPSGVAAYRAANTLDAMFGHHDERYEEFGWAAARLDDLLNWPAARLSCAITAVAAPLVGGSFAATVASIRRFGSAHPSPNAGRIESAFAGALRVQLGGPLSYEGRIEDRPYLGVGPGPGAGDIRRAARLSFAVGLIAALACATLASSRSAIGAGGAR